MTYRQLLAGNADFRRLWTGQVVSEIGDWLNNIAVLALAIQLAGAGRVGLAIAVYAIARHLPLFLFGPVAGVVVDRVDRRRVMIAADLLRALLALGFLFADRTHSLAVIYAVGASLFSVSSFFNAAKRATIPNLVRDTDELLAANSLSASTTAATIAVGSALGGVAATFLGRDAVFVLNALTFLASAEMIRRVSSKQRAVSRERTLEDERAKHHAPTAHRSLLTAYFMDFREGLRYVRREPTLFAVFVVAAGWGLGNGAARALYSIFGARLGEEYVAGWGGAARELVERPTDFGISVLFVAMGLGGVMGAPLARRFNSAAGDSLGARMGRSLALDGLGLFLFSLMPSLWAAALVLVAREMNFAIWWTAQQTILMRRTENAYAGRVFASYETLTTLM
ncbi:MAG TPA: MFS transporter, partial [Pyrinomonadaceae bacterium]